jgi:7-cyano-7-deazaguanine synthase
VLEDAFTPNRNLLFLLAAASIAYTKGAAWIVMGLLAEKTTIFPDQKDAFLFEAESVLTASLGTRIRIVCPLRDMVKDDVVRLASKLNIRDFYSCHSGTPEPCGRCIACLEYATGG